MQTTNGDTEISQPEMDHSREEQLRESRKNAIRCARVADEYKCKDVVVLDMSTVTPIVDFFVLGTGITPRQMRAAADESDRVLEQTGNGRIGMEGRDSNVWVLNDYGDIVLHLFSSEAREMYNLEGLWADAKLVDWKTEEAE
ncbi:Ribosomal silencing factor RsfS [Polystyrenella longa]|uniref:Ribosomal silencing factor RsfS n=1 Tax=Polystyrenella longa TaxID=2528007 RepID=A0A518CQG1_9PLAN|nr:ribosome silencing factor [Polystyrenella longa]QDU81455.1 Ribosomal silencing factor RsfS [Polystyrenella longa]